MWIAVSLATLPVSTACTAEGSPDTTGVPRADSVAVIAASLERSFSDDRMVYFSPDVHPLVLEAARSLDPDRVRITEERVFCTDEEAMDGDLIGRTISVSLELGEPPSEAGGDERRRRSSAFYVDQDVAYVDLTSSCSTVGLRGRAMVGTLPDGRRVSGVRSGVAYELRKERGSWVISRTLGSFIT